MRILLLGGTRFLGRRLSSLLIESGADVTVLHRCVTGAPPPGTKTVQGDRAQPDGLEGIRDLAFDTVVDLSSYFSDWTRRAITAFRGRIGHYVYVSSGTVYRPSAELPWAETTPFGPMPIWGTYGEEKVTSERLLWQAHQAGDFAVTAFRFPFILGPCNFTDRESFVFSRLAAREPILLPNGGTAINQFVYIEDAAQALLAAIERPGASAGQAYNCGHARGVTNRGFVEICAELLDVDPEIVAIDENELDVARDTWDLNDLVFPFPDEHFLLDVSKIRRELGTESETPTRRMLEEYLAWWLTQPSHERERYPREEQALAALRAPERSQ